MGEMAIAAALSKFGELVAKEAKILLEVGDNITLLRDRLEWLQAFVRDADRRRRAGTDDQLTRVWVRQTRDVSFQAEDALEELLHLDEIRVRYWHWKKRWRKYMIGFYAQIISPHVLSARITRINTRLAKITENQKEYNIRHTPLTPLASSTTATSAWPDNVVGFDDDVRSLKQMLFSKDHTRLMFISILGESGVGKSTLVKMLYNNNQVALEMGRVVIWLEVPPDCAVDILLQEEIYDRALDWCTRKGIADLHQPKQDDGIVGITDKLRRLLTEKRYLVILSGISSKTILNCVRASLPDDSNGSRVLLVLDIESEEVAWHANSMNQEGFNGIHMLSRLDEERSGELFHSRAFRREEVIDRKKRKEVVSNDGLKGDMTNRYKKIVYDITGGYPLAIVLLAGLLRFKERPGQWEAELQQLRPGPRMEEALLVQGGDGEGNKQITEVLVQSTSHSNLASKRTTTIERVFWASFEDLPNDLKSCFLYFAAFPKGSYASDMVRMWIAEGFIKPKKGKTKEELGHNYLKELVLRCLVQIDKMNEVVSVHPRLHGFLQSEAREAGFMEVHDKHHFFVPPSVRHWDPVYVTPSMRRLSFMSLGDSLYAKKLPNKLRSFICLFKDGIQDDTDKMPNHWFDLKFLCGSKFLRLIEVRELKIKKLPDKIDDLINLRYLGVVNCKDLKELPSSIKMLFNLQTLDIRGTQVEMIDPGFWKLRTLRHVLAEKLTLPETTEEELAELQTLSGVKPAAAQGGKWKENFPLHMMPNLRTLNLHGVAHDKHGAAIASALVKMHLLNLSLQGDVIPSCIFTAPSLRFLQTVELDGDIMDWPEVGWDASKVRPNLINVQVRNSYVPQHIMEEFDKINKTKAGLRQEISTNNAAQGGVEQIVEE